MRGQNIELMRILLKKYGPFENVLDVGSAHINGNIRDLFPDSRYVGIDMRPGENVGIVMNAHDIKKHFKKGEFNLVVCFDTFEHDDAFWITLENMKWVLKSGGLLVIAAPSVKCPEHDHPHDYWRFMPQSFDLFFDGFLYYEREDQNDNKEGSNFDEICGWGVKP